MKSKLPNPFNPTTTISYTIPYSVKSENAKVKIVVFLIFLAKEVATLVNEQQAAGNYRIEFDASRLTSGIYFYQLKTDKFIETKKMLLMK
ncbi:MAG: T9SS type A sorting domain-containing protein [Ignavibacteriales bacterium]|nr:T9SS type A sorting domain-containing protein [Ignavibacteriales bacterium]